MPDEPRKTIEELLQASAKARRAEFGPDQKMPNPMRARLHDEIARASREEEPKARQSWNWFAISWPVGTVAAAVLVVAFVMSRSHELQPPNKSRQATTNQRGRAKGILRPAAPQVAAKAAAESTTQPSDAVKADEGKSIEPRRFADVAAAPKSEAPAAASQPGSAASGSSSTFFAQTTQEARSNINQQFSQSLRRADARTSKLKQAVNVLTTFQIEQNGDQIRVVDADGSTYTGKIEPITQDAVRRAFKDKEAENLAARSERALPQQENNQFSFRATGYNTSLQKPIVFEGNYVATPAQAKVPNESAAANEQQSPARIVGTAKANGESPIEVDATSVPQ